MPGRHPGTRARRKSSKPGDKTGGKTIRFTQIATGPFTSKEEKGSSYSVLALGSDGRVYRYDPKCDAWIRWSNKVATCKKDHAAGR